MSDHQEYSCILTSEDIGTQHIRDLSDDSESIVIEEKNGDDLLIELFRERSFLYDKNNPNFKDILMKQNAWNEISKTMIETNCGDFYTPDYCQKRCTSLRDQYNREKKKLENQSRSGSAASNSRQFPFYSQLAFLDKVIKRRRTYSNMRSQSNTTFNDKTKPSDSDISVSSQSTTDNQHTNYEQTVDEKGSPKRKRRKMNGNEQLEQKDTNGNGYANNFCIIIIFWLCFFLILLQRKRKGIRWARRRWHTRPINQNRALYGDYDNLFQDLKNDTEMFYRYTRMTFPHFQQLLELTTPYLQKNSARALVPEHRLIITLRYLATGDSPLSIALAFRCGESTVRKIIKEVCLVLIKVLESRYLACPTEEDWKKNADGYWKRWNVPNCVGSVDGKHIRLRCPPHSGSLFYNYKKFYSIVLMAVADHLYRFTLVDIGAFGSDSDGGIFHDSQIGIDLNNEKLNLPKNAINLPGSNINTFTFFLADDAFKLSNRIMKPYSGKNLSDEQKICNYRFSRARRTVESAFGIFANKWRIFHTAICMLPETANIIVAASVCLHNYILKEEQCIGNKVYHKEVTLQSNTSQDTLWLSLPNIEKCNSNAKEAQAQRNKLCNYFLTPVGELEWQYDYISRGIHAEK